MVIIFGNFENSVELCYNVYLKGYFMLKLLLVDDEKMVRRTIAQTLDWKSLEISEIIQAEDGEQALELAVQHHVDIVITDIRMPFMDGLELSKRLSSLLPDTKIIVLTGHDEFEYARSALKLNVMDYIIKPIAKEGLTEVIRSAVHVIKGERQAKENYAKLRAQLRKTLPILKDRALYSLVNSESPNSETFELLSYCNVDINCSDIICVVFEYGAKQKLDVEAQEIGRLLLLELLEQNFDGFIFTTPDSKYCLILKNHRDIQKRQKLQEVIETLRQKLTTSEGTFLNAGIGSVSADIHSIHRSYREACHVLSYKTALGNNHTFDILDHGYFENQFAYPKKEIQTLVNTLHLSTDYSASLHNLCDHLADYVHLSRENLRLLAFEIILDVSKILLEVLGEEAHIFSFGQAAQINTVDGFKNCISKLFEEASAAINQKKQSKRQLTVSRVKQYILENFHNPKLSLQSVADALYINSSYLSAMFKRETGETLIDHVTRLRIEKALEIIKREDIHGYEVASKVGYSDPHYFSVCFKKLMGQSPSEYKKAIK